MHQNVLNLVGLLDLDANSNAVDTGLDEHPLILVPSHRQRIQDHFGGCLGLDLRDIVPLRYLRCEGRERQSGSQ